MQAPAAQGLLTPKQDSQVVSRADYEYMLNQSSYWKQKVEGFRNDVQALKSARNEAWQETSQLQKSLKEKQDRIVELERVINNFNLHQPGDLAFSPQGDALDISNLSISQTPRADPKMNRHSLGVLSSLKG